MVPAPSGKQVRLELEDPVSLKTIRAFKNRTVPHMNEYWCIPPKENPDFIAHMEDVLDEY